jgi:CBS domain-containing protein
VEQHVRRLSEIVSNQRPLTLAPSHTVKIACERMRDSQAGAVLVADREGLLIGIFTSRDAVTRVVAAGRSPSKTKLATVSPEMTALDALRLMWDGGFRHVPVVRGRTIVGVISRSDFQANEEDRFEQERTLWENMR